MVGYNFKMRICEMAIARDGFPTVLLHAASVVAGALTGNCRVYRIVLSHRQPTDAVRVTITETCSASSKGYFRSSTVTF